jgi:hypothetical protein
MCYAILLRYVFTYSSPCQNRLKQSWLSHRTRITARDLPDYMGRAVFRQTSTLHHLKRLRTQGCSREQWHVLESTRIVTCNNLVTESSPQAGLSLMTASWLRQERGGSSLAPPTWAIAPNDVVQASSAGSLGQYISRL